MVKANIGRPREPGDRYPSGDLRPKGAPAQIRRVLDHALYRAGDPRLGTEVTRLALDGRLRSSHVATAAEIGEIYRAFQGLHQRSHSARSPDFGGIRGATRKPDEVADKRTEKRFRYLGRFFSGLPGIHQATSRALIEDLCVRDVCVGWRLPDAIQLLEALAGWLSEYDERRQARELRVVGNDHTATGEYVYHDADVVQIGDRSKRRDRLERRLREILERAARRNAEGVEA